MEQPSSHGEDVLYFNPAAAGATDYKFPLAGEKLDQELRFCVYPSLANCILLNKNDCLIIVNCFHMSCYLIEYCLRIIQLDVQNMLRMCLKIKTNWWTCRANRLFDFDIKLIIY